MNTDEVYKSPTDMGVNMAGYCIADDGSVREAAKQEIVRRYFRTQCYYKEGVLGLNAVERLEIIMKQLGITPEHGLAVTPALDKSQKSKSPAMALVLHNGRIVTGRNSSVLCAAASVFVK